MNSSDTINILFILLLLLKILLAEKRPHIILIVADDLGWGDVSFHGSQQIQTPNIDSLAGRGIVLNNYYVSPICSPSRSALLSGYHAIHTGLQHDVLNGAEPWGLPLNLTLLPQHVSRLGYATAAIGKWHLGFFQKQYIPTERGFDSHFGYWTGHEDYFDRTSLENWWGIDFRQNEKPADIDRYAGIYSTELYTNKAIETIVNHSKTSVKPLFLYLAYQAVHAGNGYQPLQAPEKYVKRFDNITDERRRTFAGMVSALDDGIGQVFNALHECDMLNDSIIIFTTDNGAATGGTGGWSIDNSIGSNWPLRGAKYTLWEGGIRGVSFIWSMNLSESYTSEHLMHIHDWLPTIYNAIGGDVKELGDIDGINMWHILNHNLSSERIHLLHNIDDILKVWALRYKQYKLLSGTVLNGDFDGWFLPPGEHLSSEENRNDSVVESIFQKIGVNSKSNKKIIVNCNQTIETKCEPKVSHYCLFDIEADPCEYNDIAAQKPEIVDIMLQILESYNSTAKAPGNRPADQSANPSLHNYRWDVWD